MARHDEHIKTPTYSTFQQPIYTTKQINWICIAVKVDRLNENGLGDRKPATPGYM